MTDRIVTINGEECTAVPSSLCRSLVGGFRCANYYNNAPTCQDLRCNEDSKFVAFLTKADYSKWVAASVAARLKK